MSSKLIGSTFQSSRGLPTTALVPMVVMRWSSNSQYCRPPSSTTWGASARYFAGTRLVHTSAGSMMWSSTLKKRYMWGPPGRERRVPVREDDAPDVGLTIPVA